MSSHKLLLKTNGSKKRKIHPSRNVHHLFAVFRLLKVFFKLQLQLVCNDDFLAVPVILTFSFNSYFFFHDFPGVQPDDDQGGESDGTG